MKKLFEQWEIKKFLEPFEGKKIQEVIINRAINLTINLKNVTIKIGNEVFSFTGKDYNAYNFFSEIEYLEVDETGEITSVIIRIKNGTIINVLL